MNAIENLNGHVYYFEPNDLDFGLDQDNNAVNLTPHLEDLCISMSLTAEIKSRDPKSSSIKESTISWVSYPKEKGVRRDPKRSEQMVNGGVDLGGENFLTTYYTEISADQYIDHELVEGLGVTNVNISFESWYTPTITINFIDIHGSALWGREEAIHSNGEITSDNLLGVFFTQPYPLFRLQVKGFLGHDVTYQLSVSSFKGRYNSQTGNFEATVQFIGYSYSLLSDIPLKCLSYVSELSYVGKKYWDDNVLNNPQWQLINADSSKTPPIKLYQLIERIKNAIGTIDSQRARTCDETEVNVTTATPETKDISEDGQIVSNEEASKFTEATNFNGEISEVEQTLREFMTSLRNFALQEGGSWIDGNDDKYYQLLLMLPSVSSNVPGDDGKNKTVIRLTNLVKTKYRILCNSIEKYNQKHPSQKIVNPIEKFIKSFHDLLIVKNTKKTVVDYTVKIFDISTKVISTTPPKQINVLVRPGIGVHEVFGFNDITINGYHLNERIKEQLAKECKIFNEGGKSSKLKENNRFAYMFPFGTILKDIAKIKENVKSASTNIETNTENETAAQSSGSEKVSVSDNSSETDDWMEETRKKKIIDILGFEPTIGNFVKLVMCHLETFVEVMQECGDRIYASINSNERTYESLGVQIDATDIARGEKPYAWPALYNPNHKETNEETPDGNQKGNNYEVLGWPNDFPNGKQDLWEEKKVVLSIIEAIEKYGGESESQKRGTMFRYDGLPITGSDLFTLNSPFRNIGRECTSIEKIAPYLGLRAANIIGVGDNKCNSEDAKIIGYMDAVNMISSYSKYDKLKEAIQPKDTNQSFASQVINYLTCNPNTIPTNETESGKKYNLFETIKSGAGNIYHETRHPIYVNKDNKGKNYTYSYIYANSINDNNAPISIVPSELMEFNGTNNPYNVLFDGQKKDTKNEDGSVKETNYDFNFHINPTVRTKTNTGARQNFIYTCNTDKLIPTSVFGDYTNDQLLYVNANVQMSKTFVQQIESFKHGEVKYKNYTVKGEEDTKVKSFFDRKYRISLDTYCNQYKDWRLLTTKISEDDSDYAKEHLCFSSETQDDITYDNSWFNSSSKLFKNKITDSLKEKTKGLKENGNSGQLYIRELTINNNEKEHSLFGSRFYYQQNLSSDKDGENNVSEKCKAYLILSSIMSAIKIDNNGIFKTDKTSLIQYIQPCYVIFLGALLWRRRFWETFEEEPLVTTNFESSIPDKDTSFITKSENYFYISTDRKKECYKISDYYMNYEDIDLSVRNKLINIFENFVSSGQYATITSYCELNGVNPTSEEDRWGDWSKRWNEMSEDDRKKPSKWCEIFSNIFGNYSSIIISDDSNGLRLLFDEKNKAMNVLKELYGLNGGYIVGRSTTTRVGRGDNEVKLTSAQLNGYLNGFAERINEVNDTSEEKEKIEVTKGEEETTRDLCVSMYYSLKHLWDTWLITSKRDAFTIENFFNKNFVFIDSFYINMFNVIKLNAEDILDAYNNQDANLMTFITYPTSKEGCMFFALPSFLDSNVRSNGGTTVGDYRNTNSDLSWKKENLKKVFTPIPYNDIGTPQLNNTFVFIYTHPWSNNASEKTDYKFDSYDMTDIEKRPNALKVGFLPKDNVQGADDFNDYFQKLLPNNSLPSNEDELISARYGYLMPCFGVTVNRGNNYIFKSINVNMDSPKITNVSAQTWEDILTKTGADGSKRVFFHGQDIYSIYSQYSYACEIEMMGCAQIQPLMYFQLLNIPMWRGTYMIYKVTHTMQAGVMMTKFTGMKMSRRQAPYANGYFTVGKQTTKTGKISINDENGNSTLSSGGKFAVGGPEMIKNIFGNYTGYRDSKNYDVDRGIVKKTGKRHWHCGTDISGAEGTPLYAPWDGYVKYAKNSGTAGNYVMFVENGGVYSVVYMHCQELKVKVGDKVQAGGLLALLGKTGGNAATGEACNGAHLHLELHNNGNFSFGEERRHGGPASHIDPSENIGYIGNKETTNNDNANVNTKLLSTNKGKTDGIAIVGDSWGVGLGKYFQYCAAKNGIQVKEVLESYLPAALNSNCSKVVICCGLKSLGLDKSTLTNLFVQMGKKAKEKNKTCYVCQIPQLKWGSGHNGIITKDNVNKLNLAISGGASEGGYSVYSADNSTSNNNLSKDGYHLEDWSKLANKIK